MSLTFDDLFCCWPKLLYGRACCLWNAVFSPFVLFGWACSIYFCGCLNAYFHRGFYKVCCCCCRCCGCRYLYNDKQFPPNEKSLGKIGGDTANETSGRSKAEVEWRRANELSQHGRMQLFGETVDSNDICQGALGNCWLLAALACLAEHKGGINSMFVSKERNPRGKYRLRIYDGVKEKWEYMVIDDFIPCKKGTDRPMFSQPNGNELYAMLVEKAFAKFCGSYAATEGGQTIWALRAMTGDPARWFSRDDAKTSWERCDLVNLDKKDDRRACAFVKKGERIANEDMFQVLREYHRQQSVLCASGASGRDGLKKGHAYSILRLVKVSTGAFGGGETFRLVKIRNPWGTGEWKGDWSDNSDLWKKHPKVKEACKLMDVDDGAFWMSWEDFVQNWEKIGVVHRTVDINSLKINVKDDSSCAPVAGCFLGCGWFWCCCAGVRHLYCASRPSDETVKGSAGCGCCARRARPSSGHNAPKKEGPRAAARVPRGRQDGPRAPEEP